MAGNSYHMKFEPVDWHKANDFLATTANKQRDASDQLRQQSTTLRNATENRTQWSQHDSKAALQDRARDVDRWKQSLETCLADTESEIAALEKSKDETEQCLNEKAVPLDVVVECLTMRESRVSIDQVRDAVEIQLHKELEVVEGCKALLGQKLAESYNQLGALQEARHQLQLDIADKSAAHGLDSECIKLDHTSGNIGLWRNSTRVENGTVTPKTWDSYSNYNTMRAQAEMKASVSLRDAISHTIAQTNIDLQVQHRATNSAYRRRLHEMKQTREELVWQQKTTADELAKVEAEVNSLADALHAKNAPMMIAQTRLEARTQRPGVELCRDGAQHNLTGEVDNLTGTMRALAKQHRAASEALERLQRTLQRINNDIRIKENSMGLDLQCMQTRQGKLTDCDSSLAQEFYVPQQQQSEEQEQHEQGGSTPRMDRGMSHDSSRASTARSSATTLSQSTINSP
ncbi:tektin-2-like [Sycon ciliatum]|uniref:tektin-2-like n=1 Tax=Sycon ciliatum TaxID=27933 RepID=UPI0020ACAEF1|eukprot:scpid51362/ scgid23367/ Tektin-2